MHKMIIHRPINKRKFLVYVNKLRKAGMIFETGKFVFDMESMMGASFLCDPKICLKEKEGVYYGSCCTDYSVDLVRQEELAIVDLLERGMYELAKDYPWVLKEKIFKKNKNKTHYLQHRHNGTCVLGVVKDGRILCIIDLLTKKLGLKRTDFKPSTCFSWPFDLISYGDRIFVTTIHAKNGKYMSQDTSCLDCVSGRHGTPAYVSMKHEIEHYTGKRAYSAMMKQVKKLSAS